MLVKVIGRPLPRRAAPWLSRDFQRTGGAQVLRGDHRPAANLLQQRCLLRFEFDEPAEDVEHVEQLGGVFGEPVVGLEEAEWRGRAAVADDREAQAGRREVILKACGEGRVRERAYFTSQRESWCLRRAGVLWIRLMPESLPPLTVALLQKEAAVFTSAESQNAEPSLFGVTDGKAVGTYLEHKFQTELLKA